MRVVGGSFERDLSIRKKKGMGAMGQKTQEWGEKVY